MIGSPSLPPSPTPIIHIIYVPIYTCIFSFPPSLSHICPYIYMHILLPPLPPPIPSFIYMSLYIIHVHAYSPSLPPSLPPPLIVHFVYNTRGVAVLIVYDMALLCATLHSGMYIFPPSLPPSIPHCTCVCILVYRRR